jgi:hypothetical protein
MRDETEQFLKASSPLRSKVLWHDGLLSVRTTTCSHRAIPALGSRLCLAVLLGIG